MKTDTQRAGYTHGKLKTVPASAELHAGTKADWHRPLCSAGCSACKNLCGVVLECMWDERWTGGGAEHTKGTGDRGHIARKLVGCGDDRGRGKRE